MDYSVTLSAQMNILEVASLSVCKKRKVGCVVTKNDEVISYGFNHGYHEACTCSMTEKNSHVIHAEQMALSGFDDLYTGATLETTYAPCINCAVLIVQKKIAKVIYHEADNCGTGIKYLTQHKVEVRCK